MPRPPPPPQQIQVTFGGPLTIIMQPPPVPVMPVTGRLTVQYDGFTVTGLTPMAYTLPSDQTVAVKVVWVDAHGNVAQVDPAGTSWSSSDTTIIGVAVAPDDAGNAAAVVTPTGTVGTAQVVASADADVGAGVQQILATMDVSVVAGTAVAGTISPITSSP